MGRWWHESKKMAHRIFFVLGDKQVSRSPRQAKKSECTTLSRNGESRSPTADVVNSASQRPAQIHGSLAPVRIQPPSAAPQVEHDKTTNPSDDIFTLVFALPIASSSAPDGAETRLIRRRAIHRVHLYIVTGFVKPHNVPLDVVAAQRKAEASHG